MKSPALLAALALVCGCSQTTQSVETPLPAAEALDVAEAPETDATCSHGAVSEGRSFVICEDGALRKAAVVGALEQPVDEDVTIEDVARKFAVASQVFTGIEVATYGNLIRKDRLPIAKTTTRKATAYETVRIEGKLFDVYHVGIGEKTGTIFVERKTAEVKTQTATPPVATIQ